MEEARVTSSDSIQRLPHKRYGRCVNALPEQAALGVGNFQVPTLGRKAISETRLLTRERCRLGLSCEESPMSSEDRMDGLQWCRRQS